MFLQIQTCSGHGQRHVSCWYLILWTPGPKKKTATTGDLRVGRDLEQNPKAVLLPANWLAASQSQNQRASSFPDQQALALEFFSVRRREELAPRRCSLLVLFVALWNINLESVSPKFKENQAW